MTQSQPAESGAAPKKSYGKPTLVAYGSIGKLTQGGEGSGADGGGTPGMTMVCL
ncbi:MAG: hypothetical protein H0V29_08980 [Thermoleophilaceae bacterium]|nr:hypothetical protein [Thermoleophilaceae bacterium]